MSMLDTIYCMLKILGMRPQYLEFGNVCFYVSIIFYLAGHDDTEDVLSDIGVHPLSPS